MKKTSLPIKDTLRQAWHKVRGVKGLIWFGFLLVFLFALLANTSILSVAGQPAKQITKLTDLSFSDVLMMYVSGLMAALLYAPFQAGLQMTAIKRARKQLPNYKTLLAYANKQWPRFSIANFLISIPINTLTSGILALVIYASHTKLSPTQQLGFLALLVFAVIVTLILSLIVMYTLPSLIETKATIWQAICRSYKLTQHHKFKLFLIFLCALLISLPFLLPCVLLLAAVLKRPGLAGLLILYIILVFTWLKPWLWMIYGEVYQRLTKSS